MPLACASASSGPDAVTDTPLSPVELRESPYPDACSDERRGSRAAPCSADPDPCHLDSGFAGDEYCLLPPPPGRGLQIHLGPTDYADPEQLKAYVLNPGEEFNSYAFAAIPTSQDTYYAYVKMSMRPGSHHLINYVVKDKHEPGFVTGRWNCEAQAVASFPGTQNLVTEAPPQGIPAPENEGLGRLLPGNAMLCQNYHRYNFTDKPSLSEVWYNVWFIDEAAITQHDDVIILNAGPRSPIPAHTRQVLTATRTLAGDGRITALLGHRHAATSRFAAWLNDKLIYDSWDWIDPRIFNYDSITSNPPLDPERERDGAVSGVLRVKNGDKLKVECHVNNTTDNALAFANEIYTGEMCVLYGSAVGLTLR